MKPCETFSTPSKQEGSLAGPAPVPGQRAAPDAGISQGRGREVAALYYYSHAKSCFVCGESVVRVESMVLLRIVDLAHHHVLQVDFTPKHPFPNFLTSCSALFSMLVQDRDLPLAAPWLRQSFTPPCWPEVLQRSNLHEWDMFGHAKKCADECASAENVMEGVQQNSSCTDVQNRWPQIWKPSPPHARTKERTQRARLCPQTSDFGSSTSCGLRER